MPYFTDLASHHVVLQIIHNEKDTPVKIVRVFQSHKMNIFLKINRNYGVCENAFTSKIRTSGVKVTISQNIQDTLH